MRVLLDYRPALRDRTGVGEYVHQLARALARSQVPETRPMPLPGQASDAPALARDEIVVFSSSWRDRLGDSDVSEVGAVHTIDLRWPVRLLNLSWHRLGWPSIELLTGERFDVVHSPHPLLLPSRSGAQVVTVHDLDFLVNPAHVQAEIRRDYRVLAEAHARRADRVVVPSRYTGELVQSRLRVPAERISVCPEGVPDWAPDASVPGSGRARGFILFLGTLEARKNVAGLLAAYGRLLARLPSAPKLVLAGKAPPDAAPILASLDRAPLAGRVEHVGYVRPDQRQALYRDAALLVLPSFDEGFGLPVVEAMSLGVPVIAANRGALPEVLGDAGLLVDPADTEAMAAAMARVLTDAATAATLAARGRDRARLFSWARCAALTREAYTLAMAARQERRAKLASPGGR